MMIKYVASYRHKVFIFGQCQAKLLVDIINLHATTEDEGTLIKTLGDTLLTVVFVLDISEEFFDNILQRHHTSSTT